jgi:hypothetical protein
MANKRTPFPIGDTGRDQRVLSIGRFKERLQAKVGWPGSRRG